MRLGPLIAALALGACTLPPGAPVTSGAEPAAIAEAAPVEDASSRQAPEFPAGRSLGPTTSETGELGFDAPCRAAAAAVRGEWDGRARFTEGDLFCNITGARRTRLHKALDLTLEGSNDAPCRAAAAALQANWSGLWWPDRETTVVCALTPSGRRPEPPTLHATRSEYCSYDGESEPDCYEFPVPLQAGGAVGSALYDRPATTGRVVAELTAGENINIVGYMAIRRFAHRGIVRRAAGDLREGDVVFPATWGAMDAYPFNVSDDPVRGWDDPWDADYSIMGNGLYHDVRFNTPNAPLIEWEQLRPEEQVDSWLQLERADGTRGWALERNCALGLDCDPETPALQAESTNAHPPLLYTLRDGAIFDAAFSADGARINAFSVERPGDYGVVAVPRSWDAASGQPISDPVADSAAQADNHSVYVENGAAVIRTSDGRIVLSLRDEISRVNNALLVANGTRVATLSDNYTASLWDVATGQRLFVFGGRFDRLRGLIFSPDGAHIITWGGSYPRYGEEEPTRIWDASSGRLLHALDAFGPVSAFSPDGRRFVMVEWDELKIYDTSTGQLTTQILFASKHSSFSSVVFSPDGTRILTGDPWNSASVWDVATGQVVLRLTPFDPSIPGVRRGPSSQVSTASFSPDGTRVLTVGRGIAQVWDISKSVPPDR